MPRNEGFLDPGAGPLASFAWDLRALREKAGMAPYRVLAKRAGFCASTLSVAASGAKLPSLDVTLAYVQACGGDAEVWRARWHTLATQLPPAPAQPDLNHDALNEDALNHHSPNAQPRLHIAPPYDADEHGEPARFAAVALAPSPEGSRSSGLEITVVQGPATAATPPAAPLELATRPPMAPPPTARASLAGESPRRSRFSAVPISRVATVALVLVTAILAMRVFSDGTGNTPATSAPPVSAIPADTPMQQADALYTLIYQFTPWRSDANDAVWDVSGCRNLSNAQSKLRTTARLRQAQVEQLAELHVSKIPGNARLVAALQHAWLASAQSDTAYANIAADLQSGCTSGAISTDPNYVQADADARAATAAKNEAAQLWNANADALGQLKITGADL